MKMTIRLGAAHDEVILTDPEGRAHTFDRSPLNKSERREFARQVVATLFPNQPKGRRK